MCKWGLLGVVFLSITIGCTCLLQAQETGISAKPTLVNLQVDLETVEDSQYVIPLLDLIESYGWYTTVYVTGEFALQYHDLVKEIHDRGHEIGVHGWSVGENLSEMSHDGILDSTENAILVVEAALGKSNVVDYKPQGLSVPSELYGILEDLGIRSCTIVSERAVDTSSVYGEVTFLVVSQGSIETSGCGCSPRRISLVDSEWIGETAAPGSFMRGLASAFESLSQGDILCASVHPSMTWEQPEVEAALVSFLDRVALSGGMVVPTVETLPVRDVQEAEFPRQMPGWTSKPVMLQIQIDLESVGDVLHVDEVLRLVEGGGWRTTVFPTAEMAILFPEKLREIEDRGHRIGVHGSHQDERLSDHGFSTQRSLIADAFSVVRSVVFVSENVVDFKPQGYSFNEQTLEALQEIGAASITGIFDCQEPYCQCWYAASVEKITFPYPLTNEFWLIPVSTATTPDGEMVLDDALLPAEVQEDYLNVLQSVYARHAETKDPIVIVINPGSAARETDGELSLGAFLGGLADDNTKLIALADITHHTPYITGLEVGAPEAATPGEDINIEVRYTANIYCPKYRFHAYGKYPGEEWVLLDSWEHCFYVYTGDHTFEMGLEIPRANSTQSSYTVRVVGRASFGGCETTDPNWPTADSYEQMAELTVQIRSCSLVSGSGNDGNYDVVFIPSGFDISELETSFTAAVSNNWNAIAGVAPFLGFSDHFNVWRVDRIDDTHLNCRKTNCICLFGLCYCWGYWICDYPEAAAFALSSCPDIDSTNFTTVVLVDTTDWTGIRWGSRCDADHIDVIVKARQTTRDSQYNIMVHEFGHSFGLGDEYSPENKNFPVNYEGCANCDPSNNCSKWAGQPGCVQGCTYNNDHRSSANCMMNANTRPFCSVCTVHLNDEIDDLGGAQGASSLGPEVTVKGIDLPQGSVPGQVYVLRLTSNAITGEMTLREVVVDGGFPLGNYAAGDFEYRVLGSSSQTVYTARFLDPGAFEVSLTAPESFVVDGQPLPLPEVGAMDPNVDFILLIPYFPIGNTIDVYGAAGELVLSVDVSPLRTGTIGGSVHDHLGSPVADALIQIDGPSRGSTRTDASGSYLLSALEPGTYMVIVTPPASIPLKSSRVQLAVTRGETTTHDFVLESGGVIHGSVTDPEGMPISDARLFVSGYETPRFRTNVEGTYWIPELDGGTYTVNINAEGYDSWHMYVNGAHVGTGTSTSVDVELGNTTVVDFSQQLGLLFNFEYASQNAAEAANWDFVGLWHLTCEEDSQGLAPNPTPFPSSTHAAHFCGTSGTYAGPASLPLSALSPKQREERVHVGPMGESAKSYGELITPEIHVTAQSQVELRFHHFREVEYYADGSYDKTYVQVQFDGGGWQTVWSLDSKTLSEKAWTEAGPITIPVPAGSSVMRIKFVFDSVDSYGNDFLGWLIDDISISGPQQITLRITTQGLASGTVDEAYAVTLSAAGGTSPYTWTSTGLPLGFSLGSSTGVISGSPTSVGTYDVSVTVADSINAIASRQYQLQVNPADQPSVDNLFEEDFADASDWTMGGLWHAMLVDAADDSYGLGTVVYYGVDAVGNYDTGSRTTGMLTSPVIDVSTAAAVQIRFDHFREVEEFDDGSFDQTLVEARLGDGAWKTIWARDSTWLSEEDLAQVTVSPFATSGAQTLQLRFVFDSVDRWANDFIGWVVDNVRVDGVTSGGPLSSMSVSDAIPRAVTGQMTVLNVPNPIRDDTARFVVRGVEAELMRVEIYDLSGRFVWEGEGQGNELPWDTRRFDGEFLANGVYLYRVSVRVSGAWLLTGVQKLVILR